MPENEEIKDEKRVCNCEKKALCRFLLTILGSFLGCLVALCLYGAAIKPQPPQIIPVMPPRFEAPMPILQMDCPYRKHGEFRPDKQSPHRPDAKKPAKPPVKADKK